MPDNPTPDPTVTCPIAADQQPTTETSITPPSSLDTDGEATRMPPPRQTGTFRAPGMPVMPEYVISREVARGGMAVVYAAHDPIFDREVAVKVMHPGQDASRFVVESKVTAQLPHPGVPPVYALGALGDGRPFLAMKLIEGRTLADELKQAKRAELPRLLGIFEYICQTVGFAHSRSIIHRDLKPSNVMLGAFGEVLVMDWGLAKRVGNQQWELDAENTEVLDAPDQNTSETVAGQVKGTPAYMAPEQARGESVDARADVFALGGILAVMLTGKPPFFGDTVMGTVLKAAQAEVAECFESLDECGADAELAAVAKKCLAAKAVHRYATGEEVAAAIAGYRVRVEERFRQAERERVATEAKAVEHRKRQKVQLVLAAALLLLVGGMGAFAWWRDKQANERKLADERAEAEQLRIEGESKATQARLEGDRKAAEARANAEKEFKAQQARQGVMADLTLSVTLRKQYKFKEAEAILAQAAELAKGAPELLPRVEQAQRDLAFVVQLDDIRYRKWTVTTAEGGKRVLNTGIASPEYRKVFANCALDMTALDPSEAAKRIAGSSVKTELVAALDDWALYEPNFTLRNRLLETTRRADPGAWLDRLRDPTVWYDKLAVAQLAVEANPADTSPAALCVLAALMERRGLNPAALLSVGRAHNPTNFELAFVLGTWHARHSRGQQLGSFEAARALRPESHSVWVYLGAALYDAGDLDGAIAAYKEASKLNPKYAPAYGLSIALRAKGDLDGAIAACKEAIRLEPDYAQAHIGLGLVLYERGYREEAIAAYRAGIKLDPKDPMYHTNLGNILRDTGAVDDAITEYREAIKLNPKYVHAYNNLGLALERKGDLDGAIAAYQEAIKLEPIFPVTYNNLGLALKAKGDLDGAVAAYEKAVKLSPKYVNAYFNLAVALKLKGDVDGAILAYNKVIELNPKYAPAHYWLGVACEAKGKLDEAITAYKNAAELNPKDGVARFALAKALRSNGDPEGAITEYREALRLNPNEPASHNNLGNILRDTGAVDDAITEYREALKLNPKYHLAHYNLGVALKRKGDVDGAIACYKEAINFDPKFALAHNTFAWLLATGPAEVRDGKRAIELATKACELTDWKNASYLDTLAVAYAEGGNFEKAIELEKKALAFPAFERTAGAAIRQRLALFAEQKPYLDPAFIKLPLAPAPREKK